MMEPQHFSRLFQTTLNLLRLRPEQLDPFPPSEVRSEAGESFGPAESFIDYCLLFPKVLIGITPLLLVGIFIWLFIQSEENLLFELLAALFIGVVAACLVLPLMLLFYFDTFIRFSLLSYWFGKEQMLIRKGSLFGVQEITIRYSRIQDIRVMRGPVQQLFKLKTLVVDTAAGGSLNSPSTGTRGFLLGIPESLQLEDKIRCLMRSGQSDEGLGEFEEGSSEEEVAEDWSLFIEPLQRILGNIERAAKSKVL